MTLLLVTDNLDGHKYAWLEKLVQRVAPQTEVIVFSLKNENDVVKLNELVERNKISKLTFNTFESKDVLFRNLTLKVNSERGLRVIFWEGEKWIFFLLRTKVKCKVVFMRPYQNRRSRFVELKTFEKYVAYLILKCRKNIDFRLLSIPGFKPFLFNKLWVDDDYTFELNSNSSNLAFKSKVFEILSQQQNYFTICVPGFISDRKNPSLAIDVYFELCKRGHKVRLLFCGKIDLELEEFFHNVRNPEIIVFDEYLSTKDYFELLRLVNLVLVTYSNVGSSGIVTESLSLGTPVVFTGSQHWQELSEANSKLFRIASFDPEDIANEIENFLFPNFDLNIAFTIPNPKENVIDYMRELF